MFWLLMAYGVVATRWAVVDVYAFRRIPKTSVEWAYLVIAAILMGIVWLPRLVWHRRASA